MKYIIKYFRIALILIIMSASQRITAQITTPSETRKKAQVAIKADQKVEKVRRKEAQKGKEEVDENNEEFLAKKVSKKRLGKRSKPVKESKRRGGK